MTRFKIDENLPTLVAARLRDAGFDALTVREQNLNGTPDDRLAPICASEGRALVTLDRGFGDVRVYPPKSGGARLPSQVHGRSSNTVAATEGIRGSVKSPRRQLRLIPAGRAYGDEVLLKSFEREVLYDWADRVFDNAGSISPFPVRLERSTPGVVEQVVLWRGTPGLSSEEMAYHFAEYLVFEDDAKWVRSHPRVAWVDQRAPVSTLEPETKSFIRI